MFKHRSRCEFESVVPIKALHTRTSPGIVLSFNMHLMHKTWGTNDH